MFVEWYTQNEDCPELNDHSLLVFEDGVVTVHSNDESRTFKYVGTPHEPTPEQYKELKKDLVCLGEGKYQHGLLSEVLACCGVQLVVEDE